MSKKAVQDRNKENRVPTKKAADKTLRGVRYVEKFKKKVAKEAVKHDKKNGRGGIYHCMTTYELPYATVKRWIDTYAA